MIIQQTSRKIVQSNLYGRILLRFKLYYQQYVRKNIINKLYFHQYIFMHYYLVLFAKLLQVVTGIITLAIFIIDDLNPNRLINGLVVKALSFTSMGLVAFEHVFDTLRNVVNSKEYKIIFDIINDILQITRFMIQLAIVSMLYVNSNKELILATIILMGIAALLKFVQKIYKFVMLNKLGKINSEQLARLNQYYKND